MDKTFVFEDMYESEHVIGDSGCKQCYNRPIPCQCGGLIHIEFGDEALNDAWSYYLVVSCDQCGDKCKDVDEYRTLLDGAMRKKGKIACGEK